MSDEEKAPEAEPAVVFCHCGQPLHYTDPMVEAYVTRMVEKLGANQPVAVGAKVWLVQRHYVALHGLKAMELPGLGFPEVPIDQVRAMVVLPNVPGAALRISPTVPEGWEGTQAPPEGAKPSPGPTGGSPVPSVDPLAKSPMRSPTPTFTKQVCKLCDRVIAAPGFGEHVVSHGMAVVVDKWPGGIDGFLQDLRACLDQALAEAEGYPEVQQSIRASRLTTEAVISAVRASRAQTN